MLFEDATLEQKKEIVDQIRQILVDNGAKSAQKNRVSSGYHTRVSITGGITCKWNEQTTELSITRWAEGSSFAKSRKINAGIYQAALEAAGIVTELRDKVLVIKGKAD